MRRLRTTRATGEGLLLAGELPQVADEKHVGEVVARRGEALEILDRLLTGVVVRRAKPRADHGLEQHRLAIAAVRRTFRLRPPTPNLASSEQALTISRSVSS